MKHSGSGLAALFLAQYAVMSGTQGIAAHFFVVGLGDGEGDGSGES